MSFDPFKREWAGPADLTVEGVTLLGKFLIGVGFGDSESEVRGVFRIVGNFRRDTIWARAFIPKPIGPWR